MPWLIFQRRFYSSFFNVVREKVDRTLIAHIILILVLILATIFAFSEIEHTDQIGVIIAVVALWAFLITMYYKFVLKEWVKEARERMLEQMSVLYSSNVAAESAMSSEDNPSAEARSIVFEVTEREAYLRSEEDIETEEKSTQPPAEAVPDSEQQSEDSEEILSSEENYRSSEEKSVGLRTRKYDRTSRPN